MTYLSLLITTSKLLTHLMTTSSVQRCSSLPFVSKICTRPNRAAAPQQAGRQRCFSNCGVCTALGALLCCVFNKTARPKNNFFLHHIRLRRHLCAPSNATLCLPIYSPLQCNLSPSMRILTAAASSSSFRFVISPCTPQPLLYSLAMTIRHRNPVKHVGSHAPLAVCSITRQSSLPPGKQHLTASHSTI